MKITEENQIKIEKYLAKGLNKQELKEFEALLITDLEFAEMVKTMAKAQIAIQQEGDAILKSKLLQMGNKIRDKKKKRIFFFYQSAAAIIILLISSIFLTRYFLPNNEVETLDGKARRGSIFQENFELATPPGLRSTDAELKWNAAVNHYGKGDYSGAILGWKELSRDTLDSEKWFYMGASYIMLEQIDSAHHYLEKVDIESFYFYKAQWYQALLYLKHNQKDKAEPLLETLKAYSNEYGSNAESMLRKIY